VVDQADTAVVLELNDNDTTRADYPFAFQHRLTYRLAGGQLLGEQEIQNRSSEPMPFSTGFHPYFALPLTRRGERDQCFVEIPEGRRLIMHGRGEHFVAKPFLAQNWSVQEDVSATLFLSDLKQRELILVDPLSELEAVLNWEAAPQHRFLAIWSRSPQEPFYCLEPWTALPNSFTRSKERELILLEPGATFKAALRMELRTMS
jgi:galactose mutarotase-like enzyme